MKKTKYEQMKEIRDNIIKCTKCDLHKTAKLPVVGVGSHDAKIVFIGEGPGANEDRTGVPFCGAAGDILNELLSTVYIKREDVYICNIIKHRPPGNRDPNPQEIKECVEYLDKQIDIIKPKILCTLGRFATYYIMEKFNLSDQIQGISKIHGKLFSAKVPHGQINIIPLYHPAVATYNINMMPILKEDFKILTNYK